MGTIGRIITHRVFLRLAGLVIGGVFVYASWDKITQADRFADIVHDYDMVPLLFVNAFALMMPWTELAVGATLIVGVWRRASGLLATAMTASFMVAIAQAEIRGLEIECGCFDVSGMSGTEASWGLFLRDIPLLLGSLLVWRRG